MASHTARWYVHQQQSRICSRNTPRSCARQYFCSSTVTVFASCSRGCASLNRRDQAARVIDYQRCARASLAGEEPLLDDRYLIVVLSEHGIGQALYDWDSNINVFPVLPEDGEASTKNGSEGVIHELSTWHRLPVAA